jgi:hypothetical protein
MSPVICNCSGKGAVKIFVFLPWKPAVGRSGDFGGIAQKVGQVIEGVLSCELAGMDEAQKHIPHVSAVFGLEEIGALTVEDGALQGTLTDCYPGGPWGLSESG